MTRPAEDRLPKKYDRVSLRRIDMDQLSRKMTFPEPLCPGSRCNPMRTGLRPCASKQEQWQTPFAEVKVKLLSITADHSNPPAGHYGTASRSALLLARTGPQRNDVTGAISSRWPYVGPRQPRTITGLQWFFGHHQASPCSQANSITADVSADDPGILILHRPGLSYWTPPDGSPYD
jgi:hypothetical protein